jgi:hypothetical protein
MSYCGGEHQMSRKFKTWRFLSLSIMWALVALVIALILICEVLLAQEQEKSASRRQYLGFQFNSGIDSYREDLLVPLGFHGPAISLGGNYTHRTQTNSIDFRLKFNMGYMKNRYSHEAVRLALEIRPSWIKKLADHQKYGEFWAGFSIPMQINDLFIFSWDDAHLYWLTAYSLALATEWQKKISQKYNAVARMEIPIVGWVSRPPTYRYNKQDALNHLGFYFSEPNKSLHFETLDDYRALFIQLLFKREMRRSLLNLGLEFQYNYCRNPQKIWGLNTSILLSYQWRIGS